VAAPSPRASLGRRTVCGRTEQRRPPVSKRPRLEWYGGVFLIAAAALKSPPRSGYNAHGVNLTVAGFFFTAAVEADFEKYMPHFRPFLCLGLNNYEEHQVCGVAVGVVGDICRALEGKVGRL